MHGNLTSDAEQLKKMYFRRDVMASVTKRNGQPEDLEIDNALVYAAFWASQVKISHVRTLVRWISYYTNHI